MAVEMGFCVLLYTVFVLIIYEGIFRMLCLWEGISKKNYNEDDHLKQNR